MKIAEFIYKYQSISSINNKMLVDNLIDNFTKKYYKPNKIINYLIDSSFEPKKIINDNDYSQSYLDKEFSEINKTILDILLTYFPKTYNLLQFNNINDYNYDNYDKDIFKEEFKKFYNLIITYIINKKNLYYDIIKLHLKSICKLTYDLFKEDKKINNFDNISNITIYTFDYAFNAFTSLYNLHVPVTLKLIPMWLMYVKKSPSIKMLLLHLKKVLKIYFRYISRIKNYRHYESICKKIPFILNNYMTIIPMATIKINNDNNLMLFSNNVLNYIFDDNSNIIIPSYNNYNSSKGLVPIKFNGKIDKFITEMNYYYSEIPKHEINNLIKFYSYDFNKDEITMHVSFDLN